MYYRARVAGWLTATCVSLLVPVRATGPALRVIGGRDAQVGEYPYVVQMESHITTEYYIDEMLLATEVGAGAACTAAVLTATWVLTAAHCFKETANYTIKEDNFVKKINENMMIRYGYPLGEASKNDSYSKILKNISPTKARSGKYTVLPTDDIGLCNTEPILIDRYAKISFIDYTALFGHEVTLAGYGNMKTSSSRFGLPFSLHKPLQVMKAMLISCSNSIYPSICMVPACGLTQTAAPGDSGSAVLHPSGVVGVISRGANYALLEHLKPPSYIRSKLSMAATPISPYVDWITNVVNEEE